MRTLAVLWTALIVVGLLAPVPALPGLGVPLAPDKLIHLVLFLSFGTLWTLAFPDRARTVLVAGVVLAVATEVGQGLLHTGRSADLYDALADVIGLVIGVGLARWLGARRPAG